MFDNLKLVQIGDVHFGAGDADAIERAAEIIATEKPDLIVACGDLTQRGKRLEFQKAADYLDRFDAPVLSVPGNHDVPLLNMVSRAKEPFKRYDAFLGRFERHHRLGQISVLGLNSARGMQARRNWAEGSINLESLSEDIDRFGPHILVAHHPFIQPPGAKLKVRTRRGERALDLAAKGGVKLILTGHVHEPSSFEHQADSGEKLVSISCGTLSSRLRQSPPSLNIIRMSDRQVTVQVVRVKTPDQSASEMQFSV